ncbi:MAG: hypothetical protein PF904_02925 [Kiritimatiellae bacterium]|jgi:hypothetical protein|nr:hypothetical protein [Kiritimatiellia bacterium]
MKSTQQIIADGMAERGVPVLLIGGMALPAFDVVRQTVDIDCLISTGKESTLHDVLVAAGYSEVARTEMFVRYSSLSVYYYDVDVLLVDDITFDQILADSRLHDTGQCGFNVPCIEHMIMLKLHAMKNSSSRILKDLNDVVEILRANPGEVTDGKLHAICEKYGPDEVYEKIKDSL